MYDIQENYWKNILYLSHLPYPFKVAAACWTRLIERLSSPFISHFILAEKSYQTLPFIGDRWTVLQNKALPYPWPERKKSTNTSPLFLLSGTLSLSYGLNEAIEAYLAVHAALPDSRLQLCGKVSDKKSMEFLLRLLKSHSSISLLGDEQGVPYEVVRKSISRADCGLVFYPDNPAINECFPSKIWDYMNSRLPMLIQPEKQWSSFCLEKKSAMIYSPALPGQLASSGLDQNYFYPSDTSDDELLWSSEESKLLDLVDRLLRR